MTLQVPGTLGGGLGTGVDVGAIVGLGVGVFFGAASTADVPLFFTQEPGDRIPRNRSLQACPYGEACQEMIGVPVGDVLPIGCKISCAAS